MAATGHALALRRYVIAGGLATASHYALMAVLVEHRQWLAGPAAVAGAALGALVAYMLNRRWVFAGKGVPHRHALPRFLAVAAAGALLNGSLVWFGTGVLGWPWLAAQAMATVLVLGFGFVANRNWSFSR